MCMCACGQDMEGLEECEFGEKVCVRVDSIWRDLKSVSLGREKVCACVRVDKEFPQSSPRCKLLGLLGLAYGGT